MPILKIQRRVEYTAIPNSAVRDQRLSIEARGTLAYLLSHSDAYELSTKLVEEETKTKKGKLQRILAELKKNGYLSIVPHRNAKGRLCGQDWYVFAEPRGQDFCKVRYRPPHSPSDGKTVRRSNSLTEKEAHNIKEKDNDENKTLIEKENNISTKSNDASAQELKLSKIIHPAIRALFIVQGSRYPPKALYGSLIQLIGDTPDVAYMMQCAARWREMGKHLGDYTTWLYNWYLKRRLPADTNAPARTTMPGFAGGENHGKSEYDPGTDQEEGEGPEARKSRIFSTRNFDAIVKRRYRTGDK